MTRRVATRYAIAAAACAACAPWHSQALPTPVSRAAPATKFFRAGAASADITPPPGVGLGGSGPEGRRSTGIRTRLLVRALVLEDGSGERIALVVADLAHISANLHRLASEQLVTSTGIGADRLILSATHTHSGPGHFYGERQYNQNVARLPGYDPRLRDFLVRQIISAVERAVAALAPARLAWGETGIRGATTNRSMPAWCRNDPTPRCLASDPTGTVDTTLVMLRVDATSSSPAEPLPIGSFSIFAIHGTTVPNLNTLLDGDVQFRVVQRLTHHTSPRGEPKAVHLLANGTEGDVAPVITRFHCDLPRVGVVDPFPMPRGPGRAADFRDPPSEPTAVCLDSALAGADRLADDIAAHAAALYHRLGPMLADSFTIRRAFSTSWLPGSGGLCPSPEVGSSTGAGAEGMETRVRGWRWLFWPIILGLEEGGKARDEKPVGCQTPKRPPLGRLQSLIVVGEHGLPETAQLTVVRIGSLVLGAVPAEVTTMAGRQMRAMMEEEADRRGWQPQRTAIIGLANGFLQYVTTAREYEEQDYEGGSNLYGPGTAGFLASRLGELIRLLPVDGESPSPAAEVGPITAYPGPAKAIMALGTIGPERIVRTGLSVRCDGDSLTATWLGRAPGRVFPRDKPYVVVQRTDGADRGLVAEDGDGRLALHLIRTKESAGATWRAVLRGPGRAGLYRITIDEGARDATGEATCGTEHPT